MPPTFLTPERVRPAVATSGWSAERTLARLAGDVELARQLAGVFVSECPRMMTEVRAAVEQGSADGVRRAAHALKGSLLNFVDTGPSVMACDLERMGRDNHLEGAPATLVRLERDVSRLVKDLERFQARGSCGS